jgi:hypothetical protein
VRLTKRLACVGSTVLLTATFGLAAAPAAHAAVAPLDPTKWTVACDSLTGTIGFATALTLAPSTSNNTITVKAVTSGCTVPEVDGAPIAPGVNGPGPAQGTGDPFSCTSANPLDKHTTDGVGGTTTNGSPNISTTTAGSFHASDVGQFITGTGIPANTLVSSIGGGGTTAVLSQNATASSTVPPKTKFTLGLGTPNQPCVNIAPAKLGGTLISLAGHNQTPPIADSSGCLGLSGLSTGTSGVNITQVKNQAKGLDNLTALPKLLDAGSGSTNANVTSGVSATFGTTFTDDAWGASYGEFQLGLVQTDSGPVQATPAQTRNNTTPSGSAGNAFQGADSGHSDGFDGTTGESSGAILVQCLGKGVKKITFGIGHINFG